MSIFFTFVNTEENPKSGRLELDSTVVQLGAVLLSIFGFVRTFSFGQILAPAVKEASLSISVWL